MNPHRCDPSLTQEVCTWSDHQVKPETKTNAATASNDSACDNALIPHVPASSNLGCTRTLVAASRVTSRGRLLRPAPAGSCDDVTAVLELHRLSRTLYHPTYRYKIYIFMFGGA